MKCPVAGGWWSSQEKNLPPTRIIELVNAWGRIYQKEENKDKLEFLSHQRLKCNWDNDELEYAEG